MALEDGDFDINISGVDFRIDHDELTLYTFAGAAAIYDHVFLGLVDEGRGAYVFKTDPRLADTYVMLKDYIMQHALPMILNWKEPAEQDVQRYNESVVASAEEFPDFFTED